MGKIYILFLAIILLFGLCTCAFADNRCEVGTQCTAEGKLSFDFEYEYLLSKEGYTDKSFGLNWQPDQTYFFCRFYLSHSPFAGIYLDGSIGYTLHERNNKVYLGNDVSYEYKDKVNTLLYGASIGYKYPFHTNYTLDLRYNYQFLPLYFTSQNTYSFGVGYKW